MDLRRFILFLSDGANGINLFIVFFGKGFCFQKRSVSIFLVKVFASKKEA